MNAAVAAQTHKQAQQVDTITKKRRKEATAKKPPKAAASALFKQRSESSSKCSRNKQHRTLERPQAALSSNAARRNINQSIAGISRFPRFPTAASKASSASSSAVAIIITITTNTTVALYPTSATTKTNNITISISSNTSKAELGAPLTNGSRSTKGRRTRSQSCCATLSKALPSTR